MNPDKRDAEKQWQRESFSSREVAGRQIATHTDNRVDVMEDGEKIAFFGSEINEGKQAWITSDTAVDIGECQ